MSPCDATPKTLKGQGWTSERDHALRVLLAADKSVRAIGREMGLDHALISRRIKALGLSREKCKAELEARDARVSRGREDHIARYKNARRGIVVPPHLEGDYYELLKSGVPIAEAYRRLGMAT